MQKRLNSKMSIAIIGTGFAGVGAAIKLLQKGYTNIRIFERSATPGGTWRDNTYPGCACDIPSLLYSFSFEPNPKWSRAFSPQEEILAYIKFCIDKYGLDSYIQYNTNINDLVFDEDSATWTLNDDRGATYEARMVISGAGPFNAPLIPKIEGAKLFKGKIFHSANWDHEYDLTDKKVAVIGTGASAIQFVPEIAKQVKILDLYQRTPAWIIAKNDSEYSEESHRKFAKRPRYQQFWRDFIYYFLELRGRSMFGNKFIRNRYHKSASDHLNNSISDPDLRAKLTPDYQIGCKRVLISDNFYPTLELPHVDLINNGIKAITEDGILDQNGINRPVDTIIYGTGFHTSEFPKGIHVHGLNGREIISEWTQSGPEAYYGMIVSGYPNMAYIVGPNSGLGHNSIIHMMESQYSYILDYADYLSGLPSENYIDLKAEVQERFNERIQEKLKTMVWSDGGCKSYYLVNQNGKNSSIWPGSTIKYRKETKRINKQDYLIGKGDFANKKMKLEPSEV